MADDEVIAAYETNNNKEKEGNKGDNGLLSMKTFNYDYASRVAKTGQAHSHAWLSRKKNLTTLTTDLSSSHLKSLLFYDFPFLFSPSYIYSTFGEVCLAAIGRGMGSNWAKADSLSGWSELC